VVTDNFKLNVASTQAGKMEISIFDMQGRLVNRQSISLIADFNVLPINVVNLSPGTYTIRGIIADDEYKIIRFVKQ
ncbi:MAG: T9SS type A sorting domain-containing protein, partial [Ferruginibacter sp.]